MNEIENEVATQVPADGASPARASKARVALNRAVQLLVSGGKSIVASWRDLAIVFCLLAVFVRVHQRVEAVEFGGDAVIKWQFVRQWFYDFDWKHADLYHHHGRMGVNAVAGLSMAIFGRGWKVYYVAPFFMAILQLPFAYAIGKRIANRLAGILACLLITYLATVHRNASQLLPDPFAGTYAVIAAYFCLRFYEAPDAKKRAYLVAMGLSAFGGYLAKETFFFFFPGMTIAVWLLRRSWRDEVTFLGVMFGGFLVETALYAIFTKFSSRYAVVRAVHGAPGDWEQVSFVQLFDRFTRLHDGWKYLFFFALAGGLWLLALNVHRPLLGRALAIIGFSQPLFLTFFVKSLNPIQIWQSSEPRYLEQFTPFAGIMSGALLGRVIAAAWNARRWPAWVERFGPSSPGFYAFWALAFILLFEVGEHAITGTRHKGSDGLSSGAQFSALLNDAYERNLPVGMAKRKNPKLLAVMYDVYMNDELLARDGKLPDIEEVAHNEGGYTYISKLPSGYPRAKFAELVNAGCMFVVSKRGHALELNTWERLPSQCDTLLKARTRR